MLDYVLIGIAVMALLGVVFEEVLHVNKAKTTLFFGTFAWILLFIDANRGPHLAELNEHLIENINEISTSSRNEKLEIQSCCIVKFHHHSLRCHLSLSLHIGW